MQKSSTLAVSQMTPLDLVDKATSVMHNQRNNFPGRMITSLPRRLR